MIRRALLKGLLAMTTGDGLRKPVNAPRGQSTPVGVQPGVSSGVVIAHLVIVFGAGGGIFTYSATPALNDLIASIANIAGTDSSGNSFPAGIASLLPGVAGVPGLVAQLYQGSANFGSLAAVNFTGGRSPASVSGVPADGQLTLSSGTQGAADNPAVIFLQSKSASGNNQPLVQLPPVQLTGPNGTPAPPGIFLWPTANSAQLSTNRGVAGSIPIVQTDTSDNTNANAGTVGASVLWTIPANDAQVGTVYEIEVPFNGTMQTGALSFKPAPGGSAVGTSGGDGVAAAVVGAGNGFTGTVRLKIMVTATGAGGTVDYFIDGHLGANVLRTGANGAPFSSQLTGAAFDTTAANTIRINSVWGAAVVGETVTGHGSTFTRKGP